MTIAEYDVVVYEEESIDSGEAESVRMLPIQRVKRRLEMIMKCDAETKQAVYQTVNGRE